MPELADPFADLRALNRVPTQEADSSDNPNDPFQQLRILNHTDNPAYRQQRQEGVQTFDPIQPDAPQTVDWRRAVNEALGFNIGNAQQRNDLASMTNAFNTRQAQKMYRTFQPSFDSLQTQIGQNALSFSRGELPADVVNQMGRQAAQRGLSGGFGQGARGGGGALASRRLVMQQSAITGRKLYYPDGTTELPINGVDTEVPNRDIARMIVEQMMSGAVSTLPNNYDSNGNRML